MTKCSLLAYVDYCASDGRWVIWREISPTSGLVINKRQWQWQWHVATMSWIPSVDNHGIGRWYNVTDFAQTYEIVSNIPANILPITGCVDRCCSLTKKPKTITLDQQKQLSAAQIDNIAFSASFDARHGLDAVSDNKSRDDVFLCQVQSISITLAM